MVTKTIDKRMNIKDETKILNVFTSTISRAFNNKPGKSKLKKNNLKIKTIRLLSKFIGRNFATTSTDTIE